MLCSEGSRIYSWTMWTDVKQNGMSNKEIKKFKCVLSRIKMNQDLETVGLWVSVWCIGLVSVKWLMCIWLGMKSGPVKSKMKKKNVKINRISVLIYPYFDVSHAWFEYHKAINQWVGPRHAQWVGPGQRICYRTIRIQNSVKTLQKLIQ